MEEKRIGRQTPTVSRILPYTDSFGAESVELYNKSGRTSIEWQVRLIEDIMAVNEDGLWTHMKFGCSGARLNSLAQKFDKDESLCGSGLSKVQTVAFRTCLYKTLYVSLQRYSVAFCVEKPCSATAQLRFFALKSTKSR